MDVEGAKGPFALVFCERFHGRWKAYIKTSTADGQKPAARAINPTQSINDVSQSALWGTLKDRGEKVELQEHVVVNGYANGWIVPKLKRTGTADQEPEAKDDNTNNENFQILLEYKTQIIFELGVLISVTTLLGCIGYLGFGVIRRKKNDVQAN